VQTRVGRLSAEEVAGIVIDALAVVLELDPARLTRSTALAELGVDSLALVEVAEIVEERLARVAPPGFRFPDAELEAMRTVGDIADYASARL
jgi:acyl carrier protein